MEGLFKNVTEAEKNEAIETIITHATPRQDFFVMLMLSVSMAAFGVLLNSTVILIGSMLIAPLLYPILSLALGFIVADDKLMARSFVTLVKSVGYALAAGVIIGFLFSSREVGAFTIVNALGSPVSLMYMVVAAIAGFAAAFAMARPKLNDTLPGVAISVSLVPPLATAGIALSLLDWTAFSNALLLFLANVIGIVFSAMIVFALLRLSVKRNVAAETIKEEDHAVQVEKEKMSNVNEG